MKDLKIVVFVLLIFTLHVHISNVSNVSNVSTDVDTYVDTYDFDEIDRFNETLEKEFIESLSLEEKFRYGLLKAYLPSSFYKPTTTISERIQEMISESQK